MAIPALALQDCQLITKTFKRGCHSSVSEGATLAVLTSNLQFMRSMSKTISAQMAADNNESLASLTGIAEELGSSVNLGAAEKKDESFFTKIGNNLIPGGTLGGIFDSECIPCAFTFRFGLSKKEFQQRLKFLKELNFKKVLEPIGEEILAIMEGWLTRALSQIKSLIDMIKNLDKYADLCSFLKFFKEFICIPDLARILAILSAFLMDISFELNSIMDLVFSLIVPLFLPFLTNLLDQLMKYILLIIKPIECIIDSIQSMLGKLDYNILFKDVERLGKINSKEAAGELKVPFIGAFSVQDPTANKTDYKPINVAFDLGSNVPGLTSQRAQVLKEEERIRLAAKELERIKKASANVEGSDPAAVEQYKAQERAATEEYRGAIKDRNLSAIGKANQALSGFKNNMKGSFLHLVSLLREMCQKIDAWFRSLFDEFKKLLGQYTGGGGMYIDFASKKLAIIQFIAFIKALINLLGKKIDCDEKDAAIAAFTESVPANRSFKIWSDDQGNINIEEDIGNIGDAIDNIAMSYAKNPSGSPSEKLRSLVEYTGDPVIDTQIADAIDDLTTPSRVVLACSTRKTSNDAEQLNRFIASLSNE